MTSILKVKDPGEIEFTLTVTMPLREWIKFRNLLPDQWPAYDFKLNVGDMVSKAEAHFYPKPQE